MSNLKILQPRYSDIVNRIYRDRRLQKIHFREAGEATGESTKKLLIICFTQVELISRTIEHVQGQYPDYELSVLIPEKAAATFNRTPRLSSVHVYGTNGKGSWRDALRVLKELRKNRFDVVVLVGPPGFRSPYLPLFILFSFLLKASKRLLMDVNNQSRPIPRRKAIFSAMDLAVFTLGLPFAKIGTAVVLVMARCFRNVGFMDRRSDSGTIAIILPILPHISLTFVYREALNMLAQFGSERRILIVALEEGMRFPLHDEAKELLGHTVYVPNHSLTRFLAMYVYYLVSRPVRLAKLIDSYSPQCHPDRFMFLRIENLHVFHPMRGFALARLLEKEDVSYIHCYGTSYPATRALVVSRLLGIPFSISTFVDFDFEYPYKCLMEKLQLATFVVTCSEFCKKRLNELTNSQYEKKIHVIYVGLDRRYGSNREPCSAYHKNTKPGIFTACRLVEKKGIEYLIRACSLLKERGHLCNCLIIGDGEERERLEKLVTQSDLADQVRFLGALPNHKIWEIVGPDDLCVVPSVYCSDGERDGIPVILIEAVANGHPVVSTFVSGIPEFITDRVHGLLVSERDPIALANAIEELFNEGELRRQLVLAGQERVRRDFNIIDKTAQLWSLINDNYTTHR